MHRFKTAMLESKEESIDHEAKMKDFCRKINAIIDFSEDDFSSTESSKLVFETNSYLFEPRKVCFSDGWENVFMTCPKSVGGQVGWSNIDHNDYPDGWIFIPQGTRTISYSNDEILRDILRELKQ